MDVQKRTAEELTKRVERIGHIGLEENLSKAEREKLGEEIEELRGTLFELFEDRKFSSRPPSMGESDAYFSEKLFAMCNFARIALGLDERDSFTDENILSNLGHYAHLVRQMAGPYP